MVLQNHITKLNREDVHEGPAEGVYVYGLFLEGNDTLIQYYVRRSMLHQQKGEGWGYLQMHARQLIIILQKH